jgi:chorismate mutase / prephenate dehydratase
MDPSDTAPPSKGDSAALDALRGDIDRLDDELLALLNRRARLVEEVARAKQSGDRAFYAPHRERAIIDRLQERNPGPFPTEAIRPVFQEVISACLSLESGLRVAFLGPEGTFTHQAVKRHFGTSAPALPCGSIAAVFDEVERGAAEFGVVPVENSSEGVVSHTLDSFMDSRLLICAEIALDVDQCLMARAGAIESQIDRVYSHPQALAQCRGWLTANLARAHLVECASTSDAARRAHEDAAGAAIGTELAARLYGLAILRRKLQDVEHNVTRFLVVARPGTIPPPPVGPGVKTSLLLILRDQPGDLFNALRPLSEAGVNLTRIESRPSKRKPWEYVFFLEMVGHTDDPHIAPALKELGHDRWLRILGCYRQADET